MARIDLARTGFTCSASLFDAFFGKERAPSSSTIEDTVQAEQGDRRVADDDERMTQGVRLRRRSGGWHGEDARSARRQGREPRRDGLDWTAARLHDHREVCRFYYEHDQTSPELAGGAHGLCPWRRRPTRFGDPERAAARLGPLGAVSMPGMMDTVLNLGLNDRTVRGQPSTGDPRFA